MGIEFSCSLEGRYLYNLNVQYVLDTNSLLMVQIYGSDIRPTSYIKLVVYLTI